MNILAKALQDSGEGPAERRGGARAKPEHLTTTQSVIDFIKTLNCSESNYGQSKSVRSYLSPELSIKNCDIWKHLQ